MLPALVWHLVRRLPRLVVVSWLLVTAVFVMVHVAPGSPVIHLAADHEMSRQAVVLQASRLGIDDPFGVRYGRYLADLVRGDLGASLSLYPRSVLGIIAERLPRTVALLGFATLLAFAAGYRTGRWAAWRHNTPGDRIVTVTAVVATTVFVPWVAVSAIWLFAFRLGWLPSGRMTTPAVWRDAPWSANTVLGWIVLTLACGAAGIIVARAVRRRQTGSRWHAYAVVVMGWAPSVAVVAGPLGPYVVDIVRHAALPTLTIAVLGFGATALLVRTAMLESLTADHVIVAKLIGLDDDSIRNRHVARVAAQPIAASLVLAIAGVVGGSVVFETVFSWPGLGMTLLQSAVVGDVPLVVGSLLAYTIVFVVLHALLEFVQPWLDPRVGVGPTTRPMPS